eukprot:SAG11_NODE_362_length_10182_cov_9.886641_8_plen_132_part_00
MDLVREALILVALYCDERQWLETGGDCDKWPSVDVVQRIAVAAPTLYFTDLRCLKCLTSHMYWFRLGEYSGPEQRPVTVQELQRFEQCYDRRYMSTWRRGWQTYSGGRSAADEVEAEGAAGGGRGVGGGNK